MSLSVMLSLQVFIGIPALLVLIAAFLVVMPVVDNPQVRNYDVGGVPYMTSAQRGRGVNKYPKFADKQYIEFAKKFWTSYMEAPCDDATKL